MAYNVSSVEEEKRFETLDEAVDYVKESVTREAFNLYDNDEIDKYGLEDMLYKLEDSIRKEYGYSYPDLAYDWRICMIE